MHSFFIRNSGWTEVVKFLNMYQIRDLILFDVFPGLMLTNRASKSVHSFVLIRNQFIRNDIVKFRKANKPTLKYKKANKL